MLVLALIAVALLSSGLTMALSSKHMPREGYNYFYIGGMVVIVGLALAVVSFFGLRT